jgi:REP element-mobilizing transposase RayT
LRLRRSAVWKGSAFPGTVELESCREALPRGKKPVVTISPDSPCLSITAVAKDRLPVFRTDAIGALLCAALDEARRSGGFLLFAYVIMPDHLHIITDGARRPSDTLRFTKGIAARRIIQYLKDRSFQSSLEKLRGTKKASRYEYSLWEHDSNVMLLTAESTFTQRVHYIHQNPVRAPDWRGEPRITAGRACGAGNNVRWMMNPCEWMWTRSFGELRGEFRGRHSLPRNRRKK